MATQKQTVAAQKVLENLGNNEPKPIGEILRESGYADNTADTPSNVTESKGFIQILEDAGVTDDKISRILNEGLEASKPVYKNNNATKTIEHVGDVPDFAIRHKYLETAVKVKGYSTEKPPAGDIYNTFIQQNNINPNTPEAKELVDNTLDYLMEQTKWKTSNEKTEN